MRQALSAEACVKAASPSPVAFQRIQGAYPTQAMYIYVCMQNNLACTGGPPSSCVSFRPEELNVDPRKHKSDTTSMELLYIYTHIHHVLYAYIYMYI